MTEFVINEDSMEKLVLTTNNFVWTVERKEEIDSIRQRFQQTYNKQRIDSLTIEDYFPGLGRKENCLAYDLEWGTKDLGSIKGGSKYKYGYEADFLKIKILLQKVVSIDSAVAYQIDGKFSNELQFIANLSKEINGFKTGRTVIPKLLSIYYPGLFLPIFNDQDAFLPKLLISGYITESAGLELYLENNFKILKTKEKLEAIVGKTIENFEYNLLLYATFPKVPEEVTQNELLKIDTPEIIQKFEALEVQHYQTLLHRNMPILFPNLKYFDEEEQTRKNGQYDTQAVGIMDMLCIDENRNFVIIELKRQGTDKTLGQILRYMGWTKEELCKDGQKVKGFIIAEHKDKYLDFALKIIPDVTFMKIILSIKLE